METGVNISSTLEGEYLLTFRCSTVISSLHLGVNGIDGDGDIMNPDNLVAFKEFVFNNTDGKGVYFVMGDGVSQEEIAFRLTLTMRSYFSLNLSLICIDVESA